MNAKSINNAQKNPLYSSSGRVYFYIWLLLYFWLNIYI